MCLVICAYLDSQENVCSHISVSTKLMSDWVGMGAMFAYNLQFIKIIRIAVLMAPLINMTFKAHPINCYAIRVAVSVSALLIEFTANFYRWQASS